MTQANDHIPPAAADILRSVWVDMHSLTKSAAPASINEEDVGMAPGDDLTEVFEAESITNDSKLAFDRMVSFHDKVANLNDSVESFLMHTGTTVGLGIAMIADIGNLGYAITSGDMTALPESFTEMLKITPFTFTAGVAMLGAEATCEMTQHLSRGYARLKDLGDAHQRISDGATPYAEKLSDRLSDSEHAVYRNILKKSYTALHNQDFSQMHKYTDKLKQGISALVEKHQGSPSAGVIESTLLDIEAQLSDAVDEMHRPHAPGSEAASPGMA